ncbi:alpha/beta fold hydrolase [Phaeacidiphilus oryzae]|uniref:alpha/beta fold hydrolase n=1 Tax=Phaeacidiphilus oryzae TaxID=348818 RepID=UPI0005623B62|nr:alpha/beta hydrolase [Phaeacidiphilus oryzae]
MPTTLADGIPTRYRVEGSGPPLLMFSPGGFDAALENWRTIASYRELALLDRLAEHYTCITFDRRESGESGARLERLSWAGYARQAAGLLDALGIERAFLMGGCVGCSTAAALAVEQPSRVLGLVLYSPAGGPLYRMKQHARFRAHLAYAEEHGPAGVRELALRTDAGFSADPRVGPWAAPLRRHPDFAEHYAATPPERYSTLASASARLLFDRDTVPGVEPEDLLTLDVPTLIVPGQDTSHAPSAAAYLQECLPHAETWALPPAARTASTAPARVLAFLAGIPGA